MALSRTTLVAARLKSGTTDTSGSINVAAGDLIVVLVAGENATSGRTFTVSNSGTDLGWTRRVGDGNANDNVRVEIWTAYASGSQSSITLTCSQSGASCEYKWMALTYTGHNESTWGGNTVGCASDLGTQPYQVSLTFGDTTSEGVWVAADWGANDWGASSRTWVPAAATELDYYRNASTMTCGFACRTGESGATNVGITGFTGGDIRVVGVEIRAAAASGFTPPSASINTNRKPRRLGDEMLLLTSTSDLLRITTSGTADIKVHASYVDNASGTITPGRTNTSISSATTTTVVGSPGSSVQRAVKSVVIRNDHATNANTLTLLHTDGTTSVNLFVFTLAAGEVAVWDDTGFRRFNSAGIEMTGANTGICDIQTFSDSGTWTKPTTFTPKVVRVILWGAGGGGGAGASLATATVAKGGGGGGGGACRVAYYSAADLGSTETVTLGTAGSAGAKGAAGAAGGDGGAGGNSTFGSKLIAFGGGGGRGGAISNAVTGGGGGGGYGGAGSVGTTSGGAGGLPTAASAGSGGAGVTGAVATGTSAYSEYGGAGGAGINATPTGGAVGGSSFMGGGGGGAGGAHTSTPTTVAAGVGGNSGGTTPAAGGGGGSAGTDGGSGAPGGNGGAGSAASSVKGGSGGGGGGATTQASAAGGDGGAGGQGGGGGGGGGVGQNPGLGGNGGAGGKGYCIVYTW